MSESLLEPVVGDCRLETHGDHVKKEVQEKENNIPPGPTQIRALPSEMRASVTRWKTKESLLASTSLNLEKSFKILFHLGSAIEFGYNFHE